MTIIEAGIIAGGFAGAIAACISRLQGKQPMLVRILSGIVAGGLVGYFYALSVIFLLVIGQGVYSAAKKDSSITPNHYDQTKVTRPLVILGIFLSGILFGFGQWSLGIVVMIGAAVATATVGVALSQSKNRS